MVMRTRYWADTQEDGDRKRRREAEFLVHDVLPWRLIQEIGVCTPAVRKQVQASLEDSNHQPRVLLHRDWYYPQVRMR